MIHLPQLLASSPDFFASSAAVLAGVIAAAVILGTMRISNAFALRAASGAGSAVAYGAYFVRMVLTALFFALSLTFIPRSVVFIAAGFVLALVVLPTASLVRFFGRSFAKGGR